MEQHERLRQYNRWRRGDKRMKAPNPKELGELIDGVADRLEVLEREHTEFFERWHCERRKREKLAADVERCYRMLLSDPDTKGALFKAENILREALAELYALPGAQVHPAPSIPEGYKLVPIEPTNAMLKAAQKEWLDDPLRRTTTMWKAMLAAAPECK